MALSRKYLSLAVIAIFLSSLTLVPPISEASRYDDEVRKMVLGSRPPGCVKKCMSCRPCEATLVIPPHGMKRVDDDSYYLLSWKCRCGNKLYQP